MLQELSRGGGLGARAGETDGGDTERGAMAPQPRNSLLRALSRARVTGPAWSAGWERRGVGAQHARTFGVQGLEDRKTGLERALAFP